MCIYILCVGRVECIYMYKPIYIYIYIICIHIYIYIHIYTYICTCIYTRPFRRTIREISQTSAISLFSTVHCVVSKTENFWNLSFCLVPRPGCASTHSPKDFSKVSRIIIFFIDRKPLFSILSSK